MSSNQWIVCLIATRFRTAQTVWEWIIITRIWDEFNSCKSSMYVITCRSLCYLNVGMDRYMRPQTLKLKLLKEAV